ncbi:MAG: hypothetical protein LBT45_01500 [Rickettsiales bacterium]|jgi:hypothetical protein|nr:hypothetical protein [Rickettsiales bacterium]
MEKFNALAGLYEKVRTVMSAICVEKGGIDIDNYSGRFFAADLLELVVAFGEAAGADVSELKAELEAKKDNLTPSSKPIYEMTLAEFEKLIAPEEVKDLT